MEEKVGEIQRRGSKPYKKIKTEENDDAANQINSNT